MKRICIAAALAAGALAMAQTPPAPKKAAAPPVVKCKNVDGRACTSKQVETLSNAVFAGKNTHDVLLPVKDLSLASPDGTLKCTQNDGTVCTTPELDLIKEIAAPQQLTIKYNSPNSNPAK